MSSALDRAMEFPEALNDRQGGFGARLWAPVYARVRKTERFKTLVRKAGLVDYWRARAGPTT